MLRFTGIVILGLACAPLAAGQAQMSPAERESTLASFEYAWKTVQDTYWDPNMGGLDWKAVHDELRPKVEAAKTREQARAAMSEMLDRLKQSHFGIFPAELFDDVNPKDPDAPKGGGSREGHPGIDLRIVDGHALVTSVDAGSPAALYGVKPGWEIVKVRGADVATALERIGKQFHDSTMLDLIQTRSILGRLQGAPGVKVKVDFIDGKDQAVSAELDRAVPRGKVARMGNLPPMYFFAEWRKTPEEIGYVRFTQFLEAETVARTVEEAVKACRQCKGFIIDLRGNPGGIGGLSMGVAGWFVQDSGRQLGTQLLRGMSLKFIVSPRAEPFGGPLAILVDGNSASTSEIFAGGMKDIHRARIFGTRTAGAALPSVIERLPDGDGFQHAIANYISDGGKPLEGIGVIPDHPVHPTRRLLLEGHDAAMDAAVQWIQTQKK